jgi:hypothetical protein
MTIEQHETILQADVTNKITQLPAAAIKHHVICIWQFDLTRNYRRRFRHPDWHSQQNILCQEFVCILAAEFNVVFAASPIILSILLRSFLRLLL